MKYLQNTLKRFLAVYLIIASIGFGFLTLPGNVHAQSCVQKPSGLVSWWPGNWTPNDSQSTNHGTLTSGATYSPGVVGPDFCFDGVNDYVAVPDAANLRLTTQGTLSAWISPQSGNLDGVGIIAKRNADSLAGIEYNLYFDGLTNKPGMGMSNGAVSDFIESNSTIPLNEFSHVVVTWNSGTWNMYINGVLDKSEGGHINAQSSTNSLKIGQRGGNPANSFYAGAIDEPNVFNRALTGPEVTSLYNAGRAGMCETGCVAAPGGLVSWWPGDGNAQDYQSTNEGTTQDGASFTTGKVAQSFSLDGTNDYVTVADANSLDLTTGGSLSAWINADAFTLSGGSNRRIMRKAGPTGSTNDIPYDFFVDTSGRVTLRVGNGTTSQTVTGSTSLSLNTWYHAAAVWDNATIKLYVNGVQDASVAQTVTPQVTTQTFEIGQSLTSGTGFWDGELDELKVYNRALTVAEVLSESNAGQFGACKSNPEFIASSYSNTLSREATSTAANHTLRFTTPLGINPGQIASMRFPSGFSIPAGMDFNDIDVSWGPTTGAENELTLAAAPSGATWGALFQCGSFILTSGTGVISPSSKIIVEIGTHATTGSTGNQQITNPSTIGNYNFDLAVSNQEINTTTIPIVDSDQANITAATNPEITFDIDTATTDTESGTPYTLSLGTLSPSTLTTSGGSINSIYLDLNSNASGGSVVTVLGSNGGLTSTTVGNTITLGSAEDTITAGQAKFGLCVASTTQTSGTGTLAASANYDANGASNCTTSNGGTPRIGKINTTPTSIINTNGTVGGGRAQILAKTSVANTTPAANNYRETLTFIATGTF